jgi:hypothetical protein
MADQYIERVENLIRVVSAVRDEDFDLRLWCRCAIGHAIKDAYFVAQRFDPMRGSTNGTMGDIGEFFEISAKHAKELFVPSFDRGYGSRKQVLAALRVLLLEKMAQQIDNSVKPSWSTPHIEKLADAAA